MELTLAQRLSAYLDSVRFEELSALTLAPMIVQWLCEEYDRDVEKALT